MPSANELPPEYRADLISAVERLPYIDALRQTRASGDTIRLAAHLALDEALDEIGILRGYEPETR
jgi:hypothetical protein